MTVPRSQLISAEHPACYHLVSRCVRRAWLCGQDPVTGRSFEHRSKWIEDRILFLCERFAVELHSYAVLSNHYHLIVRFDPKACERWMKNEAHCSTTDPEALLMRKAKGKEARLSYAAHVLMENRHGLLVDLRVTRATGDAERKAAIAMIKDHRPKTVAADKGYDTHGFVGALRELKVTPHVASNEQRRGGSAIVGRTTRHEGYGISQRIRKRVEEVFGWAKTVGGFRRTRFKGRDRTELQALLVGTAYNPMRIAKLLAREPAPA